MKNKAIYLLIIIVATLLFITYRWIYEPLHQNQDEKVVSLGQSMTSLNNLKEDLVDITVLEGDYERLIFQLEEGDIGKFIKSVEVNSFIIELNEVEVIKDIRFKVNSKSTLLLNLDLEGDFEDIYNYLVGIDYIYNTQELDIVKSGDGIKLEIEMIFPLEVERGHL